MDKYLYDSALAKVRKLQYKLTLELRLLESAEFDRDGNFMKFEEDIPLNSKQTCIVWDYQ